MESGFRCSAGHQTHWQDASKGGVQIRACVDLRKTRCTGVMEMKGGEGGNNQQVTGKAVRKLKCTVPGCRA